MLVTSIFFVSSVSAQSNESGAPEILQDSFYRGKVIEVQSEELQDDFLPAVVVQTLDIEITSGPEKGERHVILYEVHEADADIQKLTDGDRVIVGKQMGGAALDDMYYVSDVYRLQSLIWILILFAALTFYFARGYGVRAFIGLALSFYILFSYLVPKILNGADPLWTSVIATFLIATISLFIAHGFRKRTTIAYVSTILTISISFVLSHLFVKSAKLFGIGTEEAFYLQFAPDVSINLQGLLLGGIIIGVLGVLDDVTTAQSAVVEELHEANKSYSFGELYKRGLSVGREHIVSLVNTLALAYTGAAFPLLLLFHIYERPLWVTLNSEIILEEIIRILVGSIALILAVPITTAIAAWYWGKKKKSRHGLTNETRLQ